MKKKKKKKKQTWKKKTLIIFQFFLFKYNVIFLFSFLFNPKKILHLIFAKLFATKQRLKQHFYEILKKTEHFNYTLENDQWSWKLSDNLGKC